MGHGLLNTCAQVPISQLVYEFSQLVYKLIIEILRKIHMLKFG